MVYWWRISSRHSFDIKEVILFEKVLSDNPHRCPERLSNPLVISREPPICKSWHVTFYSLDASRRGFYINTFEKTH